QRYYEEMIHQTGKDDTRFLVRGKINWPLREAQLNDPSTFQYRVFHRIQKLLELRRKLGVFGQGSLEFIEPDAQDTQNPAVLAYIRKLGETRVLVVQNLSSKPQLARFESISATGINLLQDSVIALDEIILKPYAYHWIKID
ncbi:MAG: alpha-glucosidase C-terminal domain-containing protein, partial [Bacteroidetes bacterium]|nr:alpha-glucosidase C-terminal domain-containing protein [Bacteroidota bacterium]